MKALVFLLFAAVACRAELLADAWKGDSLKCALTGDGRNKLELTVTSTAAAEREISISAGLVCADSSGTVRVMVIFASKLAIPAGGSASATIPTVALAGANPFKPQPFHPTGDVVPALDPLLKRAATQTDLPTPTTQLLALLLLENVDFAAWQRCLAPQRTQSEGDPPPPLPVEVSQAIDALALLRELAPGREFALAKDADLRARALRNPWCRNKAAALYGLNLGDGSLAPDISQLLHMRPNDNCPVCRQRAQMRPAPDL